MDDISKYIDGTVNVFEGTFTVGRERISPTKEYVVISYDGQEMFGFFRNPQKKVSKNPPKHTGGKPSYVKLMIDGVRNHAELSVEAAGFLLKLSDNIQWQSNLIVNKRTKKALTANEIQKVVGVGRNKTLDIIKELHTAQLLSKDKDGYRISPSLIQKGGAKK